MFFLALSFNLFVETSIAVIVLHFLKKTSRIQEILLASFIGNIATLPYVRFVGTQLTHPDQ